MECWPGRWRRRRDYQRRAPPATRPDRPLLRRRRGRGRSASAAGQVTLSGYPPWTRSPPAWCPICWSTGTTRGPARPGVRRVRHLLGARSGTSRRSPAPGAWTRRGWRSRRCSPTPTTWACMPSRSAAPDKQQGNFPPGADPPGADRRRVQPRPCPRRVNRQDLVMTAHLPGGEARFVAEGSHGREGAPGNTRRSEPPVNPARFTCMSKEESRGIPNGITTCGRK